MKLIYSDSNQKQLDEANKLLSDMREYKLNLYKTMNLNNMEISHSIKSDKDIQLLNNAIIEMTKLMMPVGFSIGVIDNKNIIKSGV